MDSPDRRENLQLVAELECKKQELHSANQHLATVTANLRHLEDENTELKNELEELSKRPQNSISQEQIKNAFLLRQQIAELQQCLEESQNSEKEARADVLKLEKRIQHLLETAHPAPVAPQEEDNIVRSLHLMNSELQVNIESLQSKLTEATNEMRNLQSQKRELENELKSKDEEIECIEGQFSSQCNINEGLREENAELRVQLESETCKVDTKRKGNSLFSEVDDRRVAAETRIVKLESSLGEVKQQLAKEQRENKRLKQQVLLLRQTSGNSFDADQVKTLQRDLEKNKKHVLQLTESLQKKDAALAKVQPTNEMNVPVLDNLSDNDKSFIRFLQGLVSQKKKELEESERKAQQNYLDQMHLDLHLTQVRNELMNMTHDRDRLRSMNAHLSMTVQELQQKYEPELVSPQTKKSLKMISVSETAKTALHPRDTTNLQHIEPSNLKFDPVVKTPLEQRNGSKENVRFSDDLFKSSHKKSVSLKSEVSVISPKGERMVEDLKENDERGTRLLYTQITTEEIPQVKEEPDNCRQQ
ncbi:unnamed protein product [Lymnaea stagnalis]|uniref:Uncharacterized protein n=1 Tax=Lymnaea stagnalis TaxID=6523 RepID=A0AAV2HK59_LYMST